MRTNHLLSVMAAALLGTAACTGALTDTNPGGDDDDDAPPPPADAGTTGGGQARALFDSDVAPIIGPACAGCHAGAAISPLKFLGANSVATEYYSAIVASPSVTGGFNPALAGLLTKGVHEGGAARALTTAEKAVVTGWMQLETEERAVPGGADGGVAPADPLAQFSACMDIADWNASLAYTWAGKASAGGTCSSCHSEGAGGFFANNDVTRMFEMTRYQIFLQTLFLVQGDTVVVNEAKLFGKANAAGHPEYALSLNTDVLLRLKDFHTRTMTKYNAGTCPPAGYPPPPL